MKFECKTSTKSNKKRTSKILAAKSVVRRSIKILNNKQQERRTTKQGKYHNNCLQSELETINFFTKQKVVPQMFTTTTTTPNKTRPTTASAKTPQTLPKPKIAASSKPTTKTFTRSQTPNARSQQQQQQPVTPLKRQQPVKAPNTINVLSKTPSAYARRQAQTQEKQQEVKTPSKPALKSFIPKVKSQSSIKKPVTTTNTPLNDGAKRGLYASNNAISEYKKPTKLTQIKRNIRRSLGFLKKCSSKEQLAVPLQTTSSQSRLPIPSKTSSITPSLSRIPLRIGSTQTLNTDPTNKSDDTMIQLEHLINKHESNGEEILVALPLSSLKRIINTPKAAAATGEARSRLVLNDVNMEIEEGGCDENEIIENDLANSKQIEIMNKSGNHIKVSESSAKSQQIPKFFLQQPKSNQQHNIEEIVSPFSMRNLFKPKTPQPIHLANTNENLTPTGLKRLVKTPKQKQQEDDESHHVINKASSQKRQQIGSNLLEAISPAVFNCMYEGGSPTGAAAAYKKPPFYKQFLTPNNNSAKKLKMFGDRQSTSKKITSKYISPYVFEDVRLLAGSDEEQQHLSSDLIKFDVDSLESTNDSLSQLEQLCSQKPDDSQSSSCVEKQVDVNNEELQMYCVDRQFLDQITSTVISLQNKVVELEEKVVAGSQTKVAVSQVEETSKLNAVEVVYSQQEATCENGVVEHLEVTSGQQIVQSQETQIDVANNEIVNESIENGEEKVVPIIVIQEVETNENEMDVSVNVIVKENEQITISNDENEVSSSLKEQQESIPSENTEQTPQINNKTQQENVSPFATKNFFKNKLAPETSTNRETLTPVGMRRLMRTPRTRNQHRVSIVDSVAIETLFKEQTSEIPPIQTTNDETSVNVIAEKNEQITISNGDNEVPSDLKSQQESVPSENAEQKPQINDSKTQLAQENVSPFATKNFFKNKLASETRTNRETLTPVGMKRLMKTPRTPKQHRVSIVDSVAIETLFKETTNDEEMSEKPETQPIVDEISEQEPVVSEKINEKVQQNKNNNRIAEENMSPFAMKNLFKNKLAPGVSTHKETLTPIGMKRLLRSPKTRKQHRDSIVDSTAIESLFKEQTREIPPIQTTNDETSVNVIVKENEQITIANDENEVSSSLTSQQEPVVSESTEQNPQINAIKTQSAQENVSPFAMKNLFKNKLAPGMSTNKEALTPVGMRRLMRTPRTRKQHRDSIIDSAAIETLFKETRNEQEKEICQQPETQPIADDKTQQEQVVNESINEKAQQNENDNEEIINDTIEEDNQPENVVSNEEDAKIDEQVLNDEACVESIEMSVSTENKQVENSVKQMTIKNENKLADEVISPFAMKNLFKGKTGQAKNTENLTPVGMKRLLRTPRTRKQHRDSVIDATAIETLFKQQETVTNEKPPVPTQLQLQESTTDNKIVSLKKQKSEETCVSPFAMKNLFRNKLKESTTNNSETLTPVGMKRLLRTPRATRKQQQQQQRDSVEPAAINNLFQQEEASKLAQTINEQIKPSTSSAQSQNLDTSMEDSELELISQSTIVSNLLKATQDLKNLLTPNDLLECASQISLATSLTCESIDRLLATNKQENNSCQGNTHEIGVTPSVSTEIRQITENLIEIESDEALCQLSNALTGDDDDNEEADEEMSISYVEMKNQSVSPMDVDPYVAGTSPISSIKQKITNETDLNVKVNESSTIMHTTPTTPLLDCKVQVHLNLVNDACTNNNNRRIMDVVDNTNSNNNNNNNNNTSHYNNKVEEGEEEEEQQKNNVDDFILIKNNNNNNNNINRNSIKNILNNNYNKKMVDTKTDHSNSDTTSSSNGGVLIINNDIVDLNKHKSSVTLLHENGSSNLENSKQINDDTTTKSTNGSSKNNDNGCEKVDKSNEADLTAPTTTTTVTSAAAVEVATVNKVNDDKSTTNVVDENNKKDEGENKSKDSKMDVVEKKSNVEQVAAVTTEKKKEQQVVEEKGKEEEKAVVAVEEETKTKTTATRRNVRGNKQQQPAAAAAQPVVDATDSGVEATKPTRSKRNQKGKGANEKEQEAKQSSQEEEKIESEITTKSVEKPDEVIQETHEKKKEEEVVEKNVAKKEEEEEAKPVTVASEEKPVEEEIKVETVEETKKPAARGGRAKAAPKGKKGKQVEEPTTTTTEITTAAVVTSKEPEVVVEEKKEEKVEVAAVVEEAKAEEKEVEEKPKGKKAPAKKAPARGRGKAAAAKEADVVEEVKEEETKKEAQPEAKVEEKKAEEAPKTEEKKEENVAETENEEETTPKTKAAPKGKSTARNKKTATTTTTTIEVKVEEEKPAGRVTRSRQVKFVEEVKEPEPEPVKKSVTPAKGGRTATKRKAQAAEPEPVEPEQPTVEVAETTKKDEEQQVTTATTSNAAKRRAIGKKQQKEKEPEPEPVVEKKVVEEKPVEEEPVKKSAKKQQKEKEPEPEPVVEKKVVEEKPVEEEPVKKSAKKQEEKHAAEPEAQKPTTTTTAKKGGRGASKRKVSVDLNDESTASQEAAANTDEGVKRVTRAQLKRSKK